MNTKKAKKPDKTTNKKKVTAAAPEPVAAATPKVGSTRTPTMLDPFDRFWIDDFMPWLSDLGQRWPTRMFGELAEMRGSIRVEELVDGNDAVIRAELPGMEPGDIDVSVNDDRLTIKGERRSRTETTEDDTFRSEFRYGSFTRVMPLPDGALADNIKASYVDGVLELRIPVAEDTEHPSKKIPVTRG
jgi:HSP20 family protein